MKHIVTLSLVFFSLTHLAKAERIEGMRLLTKQYCDSQQVNKEPSAVRAAQPDTPRHPFFLSYSALTAIGVQAEKPIEKHRIEQYIIVDLTIKEITKNNSP
jgi:hypothetical protein